MPKNDNVHPNEEIAHRAAFEKLYKELPFYNITFPLAQIDEIDWARGKWANPYYSYFYKRFTTHIYSLLDIQTDDSLLIIGCGFGFDEKNISSLYPGAKIWSIDISKEMLIRSIRSGTPSNFSLALAEKLPFPDNSFDKVLSREVIEHVIDPQSMLNEINRVLKHNGLAVITTENEESLGPTNFFDGRFSPTINKAFRMPSQKPSYKDSAPTLKEMKLMTEKAKLKIEKTIYDGASYKYLISLNNFLRDKLTSAAHYLSCLENNNTFAFLFCDQVKYKLRKHSNVISGNKTRSEIVYVCPEDHSALTLNCNGDLVSPNNNVYPFEDGFFNFLDKSTESWQRKDHSMAPANPILKRVFFKTLNLFLRIMRKAYCGFYIILLLTASVFMKKNNTFPTTHFDRDFVHSKYIMAHKRTNRGT